ncbi:hypothetical protein [Bordetella genomosp. 13]|nr:hypothetical protein [Bordetella genomosp. 13]
MKHVAVTLLIGIILLLGALVAADFLRGAWLLFGPKPKEYTFVLGGQRWEIPSRYSIIRDGELRASSLTIHLQYPDMLPRSGITPPDDNMIIATVKSQQLHGEDGVSQPVLRYIKEQGAAFLGEMDGFLVYRKEMVKSPSEIYWFKSEESDYSMYVHFADSEQFLAYHVTRSLGDAMTLSYSVQKVHLSELAEIDARVVARLASFIKGPEI